MRGSWSISFSDDCSTDRTFEIIQECVAAYKGGRRVVVTQPPTNQHLAGNTNHAIQFVESDWIVRADDDDLSSVDRCSIIGRAIAEHPEASFVFTRMENFTDENAGEITDKARSIRTSIPEPNILDTRQNGESAMDWFCKKVACTKCGPPSTSEFSAIFPKTGIGWTMSSLLALLHTRHRIGH